MIVGGIYIIKNILNDKCYVGSTTNITRRFKSHTSSLKNNKHYSKILQYEYNKYGSENFKFEILEKVEDRNNLCIKEQLYLDKINPKYNTLKIAYFVPPNKIKKLKIYQYDLNGNFIKEWNTIIEIEKYYNKTMNHITNCIKNRKTNAYGYQWSNYKNKMNKIKQINKKLILFENNIEIKQYDSLAQAARDLNVSYVTIKSHCDGKTSTSRKFNKNYTFKLI